jgi:hypothetical protein
MEATYSSETSADFRTTIWRYVSEDRIFQKHRCDTIKSYKKSSRMTGFRSRLESLTLDIRMNTDHNFILILIQCECDIRAENIYQSAENLREGTTKNTKHQKTLTAAQISRSMRH